MGGVFLKTIDPIAFAKLENFNIYSLVAIKQIWREGQTFVMKNPRIHSAFLLFCGCSGRFRSVSGEVVEAPLGTLVYIPEGAMYELTFFDKTEIISTLLVQFRLNDGEDFVLFDRICTLDACMENTGVIDLIHKMVGEFSLPSKPYLKLKRDLFGLLSLICEAETQKSIKNTVFKTIEKGIDYLQNDVRQELSIDEIAKLCFVSPAYFRRLFKDYSGMSPSEYRTERRVERARKLLEHTEISIEDLSELLGYSDPSYFCRVFKSRVGCNPSEYKKRASK